MRQETHSAYPGTGLICANCGSYMKPENDYTTLPFTMRATCLNTNECEFAGILYEVDKSSAIALKKAEIQPTSE